LPANIPSHIDADVSDLEMHGVLRISGLPHSDKIKYLKPEDATVAHVVSIREEAPTAAEVEAAAAATAAAAEGATTAEPEVAKKGGKTEDAAKKPEAGAKKSDSGAKK
jgi:large subunit ribosomal protein L25